MSDDAIHDILEQTESDPAFQALFDLFEYSNYDILLFCLMCRVLLNHTSFQFYMKVQWKAITFRFFYDIYLQIKLERMEKQRMGILAVVQKRVTLQDLYLQSDPFRLMIQVFLQSNTSLS